MPVHIDDITLIELIDKFGNLWCSSAHLTEEGSDGASHCRYYAILIAGVDRLEKLAERRLYHHLFIRQYGGSLHAINLILCLISKFSIRMLVKICLISIYSLGFVSLIEIY